MHKIKMRLHNCYETYIKIIIFILKYRTNIKTQNQLFSALRSITKLFFFSLHIKETKTYYKYFLDQFVSRCDH